MSINQKLFMSNFIKWVTDKYTKLEKQTIPHAFKLAGIIYKANGTHIKIEFSGQSHCVELELSTIINRNMFEYFSSEDKKTLFDLAYNNRRFTLSDIYLCSETKQNIVVITESSSGNKMTLKLSEITNNTPILTQLCPEDTNRIGYHAGIELMASIYQDLAWNNDVQK